MHVYASIYRAYRGVSPHSSGFCFGRHGSGIYGRETTLQPNWDCLLKLQCSNSSLYIDLRPGKSSPWHRPWPSPGCHSSHMELYGCHSPSSETCERSTSCKPHPSLSVMVGSSCQHLKRRSNLQCGSYIGSGKGIVGETYRHQSVSCGCHVEMLEEVLLGVAHCNGS